MGLVTTSSNDVLVRVGNGRRAHVFRPATGANAKRFELLDGGTAYDRALCGAGGALRLAPEGDERCKTCDAQLERLAGYDR